jgi:FkbM family methyltransferase
VSFTRDHDPAALRLIEARDVQFKMYVTPHFERHYLSDACKPYTARLLAKMCERASLFVDIGAHYGFFTLHAASRRPDLKIIAVEPASSNFDILNRNISLNNLKNVQTRNIAISDTDGEEPFHVFDASDNRGLHLHGQSRLLRTEMVQTRTVDALLSNAKVGPLVIKIDTEGHEPASLAGMKRTLQRFEDVALFVGFNPKLLKAAGHDPSAFLREIDELGLAIFLLDDKNGRHFRIGLETNWAGFMNPDGYANLVCLSKKKALSVLFVSHSSEMGGAERSLLELVDELAVDHWVLTTVICPRDGVLPRALRDLGASVCIASYGWWGAVNGISDAKGLIGEGVRSILRLLPLLRGVDPDVVWTQSMVIPWGAIVGLLLGKRHVWSICEYGEKDHHFRFAFPFQDVVRFVERSSDFIFAGSPSLLEELLPGLKPDKADYLFRHIRVPKQGSTKRKKFWKAAQATRLAIFGSIEEGKGQEDLVRAVARLDGVELLIVGADSGDGYLARLQALVEELGATKTVTFPGFIPDPYPVMASADIVVTCSRAEAFGRTVIEAMLLRRAIIYSRSGAHLDYMIDGTTGLSYAPGNVAELVECIESLVARPELRKSLGEHAVAYATKTFTRANYGGKVFNRLLNLRDGRNRRTTNMLDAFNLFHAGLDTSAPSDTAEIPVNEFQRLNHQIEHADGELRRLVAEINERDRRLVIINEELRRVGAKADSDLRIAIGEIEDRDRQLAAADGEVRRLMAEIEASNRRLTGANDELRRVGTQADSDLRLMIGEVENRDRQLVTADGEIRRLMAEVVDRDRQLVAGNEEVRRVGAQADSDLRRAIGEMQERERQLIAADGEVRRLMAEVIDRDQQLVAGNEEVRRVGAQADSDLRRAIGEIQERERQLVAADGEVRRLMAEVVDRDQKLAGAGEESQRMAAQADSDLRRAIGEIQERERQLVAADGEVRRLMAEVVDRDQKLVGAGEELQRMAAQADSDMRRAVGEIQERDQLLADAKLELRDAIEEIGERDRRLSELEHRIHEIEMSTTWRVTAPMRTLFSGWREALRRLKKPPT